MIVRKFYRFNEDLNENLYKTYSDENYKIRQIETGIILDEAVDVESANYTYEETDEKIEYTEEATEEDYINSLNQLGVFQ